MPPQKEAPMRFLAIALIALGIVLGACGSDDNNTSSTPKPTVASQGVKPGTSAANTAPAATKPATTPTAAGPTATPEPLSDGNAPGIPPLTGDIVTDGDLRYIDEKVGDGPSPTKGQHVTVNYTGWLTNGTKFDSSLDRNQPFQFVLGGQVIAGWNQGVATMKVGGKRRLIIPASLGYGARGSAPRIPPNATLIFDVELLSIQP
jgi:peptidylprolyl isomerase